MIQRIFDSCVDWLHWLAAQFGTDYVTINVVLFCVIVPLVFLTLLLFAYWQYLRAEHYKLCWQLSLNHARAVARLR
jgi:hypothetical protein